MAGQLDMGMGGGTDTLRITLAEVWAILRRRGSVIGAVFVLTLVGTYVALALVNDRYEARSSLLVKLGRENLDPPPTVRNNVFSTGLRREDLATEVQILRAPDLLRRTVDAIGQDAFTPRDVVPDTWLAFARFQAKRAIRAARSALDETLIALGLAVRLSPRDQAVAFLQRNLVIEPEKESDVVALRLRMADSGLAVRIQETLIGLYLQRRIEVRQSSGVRQFLDQRTAELRTRLDEAEGAVSSWKARARLSSPQEQKDLLLRQIRALAAEHARVISDQETLYRQMASAAALIESEPERVLSSETETPNATRRATRERLSGLEARRAHMISTYQADAEPVLLLDDEIRSLRAILDGQPSTETGSSTSELNPTRQRLEQRLHEDQVRYDGLGATAIVQQQQLALLADELAATDRGDERLIVLEREQKIAEQSYVAAAGRRQEAELAAELDLNRLSNVSVAVAPSATLEPVYPRRLLILEIAAALGLVLGIILALVLEWTSDTLHDPRAAAADLGIVCLGTFDASPRRRGPGRAA
jgi:uncharacterized protein involved in exopolysaccharide biosynthesis